LTRKRQGAATPSWLSPPPETELWGNAGRLKDKSWPFAAIELLAGKRTPESPTRCPELHIAISCKR
jgi:hypothetical protein